MSLCLFSVVLASLVAADDPCTPLVSRSLAIKAKTDNTPPQSMLSVDPWNGDYPRSSTTVKTKY
jgi:hypothetical protein